MEYLAIVYVSVYEYIPRIFCSIIFWNNYPMNVYTGVANSSKGAQANGATVQFLDANGTPVGNLVLNGSAVQRWPYVAYLPTGTPTTTSTPTNTATPSSTSSLTFGTTPSSTNTMSQTPTASVTVRIIVLVVGSGKVVAVVVHALPAHRRVSTL